MHSMSFALIELSSLAPIKAKLTGFRKVLYSWEKKVLNQRAKAKGHFTHSNW